jgi:hypothetical protein
LQKGLVAEQKSLRLKNTINSMIKEIDLIAHSCGVRSPRGLNRSHARLVQEIGCSIMLSELYLQTSTNTDE